MANLPPSEAIAVAAPQPLIKLDLGCGTNKRDGFIGVDAIAFPGVDQVFDLMGSDKPWPWGESSVEEVHCSHFVEHLTGKERCRFANELWRVMIPEGKATVVVPHWASCRAYGDPTHQWPPVSEFWFYYLKREWRMGGPERPCPNCQGNKCAACAGTGKIKPMPNAPHTDAVHVPWGFSCDFEVTWGYVPHIGIQMRNQEYQQNAFQWHKEAISDMVATMTCKK